jgi:hypothetical protein
MRDNKTRKPVSRSPFWLKVKSSRFLVPETSRAIPSATGQIETRLVLSKGGKAKNLTGNLERVQFWHASN